MASDAHVPDLEDVKHSIEAAREAEHTLEKVMPNAIHVHDDEYSGMTGGASRGEREDSREETEGAEDRERAAEAARHPHDAESGPDSGS